MIETFDILLALGGLVAGLMVGLTGMGGAVLVTPLLILVFGIPASAAVSSDVVASAVVKPVGSLVHARRGTVHWGLALWLSIGSVPGVLLGTLVFARYFDGSGSGAELKSILGVVLLLALAAMVVRTQLPRWRRREVEDVPADDVRRGPHAPVHRTITVVIGFVVGMLVGITSVGSGSLIVTSLLLLYPLLLPSVLVGTDLLQAVPMLAAGAIAHATIGVVDWRVTAALLVGEIPGVWLGARMSSRYNGVWLRYLLMVILTATALRLLGVPTVICGTIAVVGVAVVIVQVLRQRAEAPVPAP